MLFDLQGKRRRVIQVVFVGLALAFALSFIGFGIGSDVQGGLVDAFTESDNRGDSTSGKRVESAEARLRANPRDEAALTELIRARYALAGENFDRGANVFTPEGKAELERAHDAWQRYLALPPTRPDPSLAGLMVQAYGEQALNRPRDAVRAAQIVAAAKEDSQSYLALAFYAAQAKQQRTARLAGQKAIDLAPRDERKQVREQVKQIQAQAAATPPGGEEQGRRGR